MGERLFVLGVATRRMMLNEPNFLALEEGVTNSRDGRLDPMPLSKKSIKIYGFLSNIAPAGDRVSNSSLSRSSGP